MANPSEQHTTDLRPIMEEFVDRRRAGEEPLVEEYVRRYPELADEIRELFPALLLMEDAGVELEDDQITADGTTLKQLGDYRILREIGRGGMGVVYEAEQESLGRHVAIKVLPYHALMDPQQLQRFQREARAAAQLHHSNIVPVFGVGEHDGVHYFAMQHIRGQSLDAVLKELKSIRSQRRSASSSSSTGRESSSSESRQAADALLSGQFSSLGVLMPDASGNESGSDRIRVSSENRTNRSKSSSGTFGDLQYFRSVANIGAQVGDALAYAHHQGVLHRDVKPSNLLLDASGTVWLTDFGLAKSDEDNLTRTGDYVGTLRYMAPERFSGKCDQRSDIYSLGLTLYELLRLEPAFFDVDRAKLIKRVTQDVPVPLRRIDRTIPRNLETIILKAISREPSNRYESAAAVADDLRQFVSGKPIEARRTPAIERTWLWCRRNQLSALLISAVFALLTASSIGSLLYSQRLKASLDRAVDAESKTLIAQKESTQRLYDAYVSQARAVRFNGRPGRRIDGLAAIEKASKLRTELKLTEADTLELRTEAIACLGHFDLRLANDWQAKDYRYRSAHPRWAFDPKIERYARELETGELSIRHISDDVEVMRLAGIMPASADQSRPYLVFSPNGRFLGEFGVFDGGQAYVQLFDTTDGRQIFSKPRASCLHSFQRPIGFTSDSATFAFLNDDKQLCQYDIESGKESRFKSKERPTFICFSPDGSKIAVEERWNDMILLDAKSGKELDRFVHPDAIGKVAWSPDGRRIAVPCGDHKVYVWDPNHSKEPVITYSGHEGAVRHVAYNSGNLLMSTSWDQTTHIWDSQNGQELMRLDVRGGSRFSEDDRWIGCEYAGHSVQRYEVVGGKECRVLSWESKNTAGSVVDINFSPDGRWLAGAASYCGFRIWDLDSGRAVTNFSPYANSASIKFSREGTRILTGGLTGVDLWKFREKFPGAQPSVEKMESLYQSSGQSAVYVSQARTGKLVLYEREAGLASVFAADRKTRLFDLSSEGWMHATDISPDGRWIATGSWHTTQWKVWNADTGELVKHEKLPNSSAAVQFSPDGNWMVIRIADAVEFRKVGTWELDSVIQRDTPGYANVAFSPDMKLVAITEMRDTRLFDFSSKRLLAVLHGPRDSQRSTSHPGAAAIRFSPDSNLLAIGTYDDSIELWDLALIRTKLASLDLDW